MKETKNSQEYKGSEPLFNSRAAELISIAIVTSLLAGVGEEALGPEIGPLTLSLHGIFFGALKTAYNRKEDGKEAFSPMGIAEMVTRSITAATSPFLIAGAIQNPEIIGNTLNQIDQTLGIKEGIPQLMDNVGKGLAENGPKVARNAGKAIGGTALTAVAMAGTALLLKKTGTKLAQAYQVFKAVINEGVDKASKFAKSFNLQNPLGDAKSPIKVDVKFQNPNLKPMIRRRKD